MLARLLREALQPYRRPLLAVVGLQLVGLVPVLVLLVILLAGVVGSGTLLVRALRRTD